MSVYHKAVIFSETKLISGLQNYPQSIPMNTVVQPAAVLRSFYLWMMAWRWS